MSAAAEMAEAAEPTLPPGVRIITAPLFRVRDGRRAAYAAEPPPLPPKPVRRPAKVARLLALAHRLEAAIAAGEFADRADVARRLGFTRARVTQLLDLTLLAPDIQEAVLALEAVDGVEPVSERELRAVVRLVGWAEQRALLGVATVNRNPVRARAIGLSFARDCGP